MNTQMVAIDPAGMVQAQHGLIEWRDQKLATLKTELTQAHNIQTALRSANMSDAAPRRLITGIRKREAFYAKIKAALEAGYYILPPIPHQTFAIRSAAALPPEDRRVGDTWKSDEPSPQNLPVGEGEYHNATVQRDNVDTAVVKDSNGKEVTRWVRANTGWKDVEFPFFPVKPEIIEATGKALSKKIFDWLGVAPKYRRADPIVIGCIKHWKAGRPPVHFFVAWWLDTDTL